MLNRASITLVMALAVLAIACSAPKGASLVSNESNWFPMTVGNYWVYTDSVWKNEVLVKSNIDTIKITKSFDFNGYVAYQFSDKKAYFYKSGDIYQVYKGESGNLESSLVYGTEHKWIYQCSIDGDNVFERTVETRDNKYFYSSDNSFVVVKRNVGIEIFTTENSNVPNIVKRKRNLISYQLK